MTTMNNMEDPEQNRVYRNLTVFFIIIIVLILLKQLQ